MQHLHPRDRHWQRTQRLTLGLFLVWAATTFGSIYFAHELSRVQFFGWPLSFFMGAQGTLFIYGAIIWIYARRMERIDADVEGVTVEERS